MPDADAEPVGVAGRHVVLVGAMGSGKSTIGVTLAVALRRAFVDNDSQLFDATGSTAAQIEAGSGIDALHTIEARVLLDAVRTPEAAVIAAAASTIVDPEVREELRRAALVVWLRASPANLIARMSKSETRPFADQDAARLVARQSMERDPLFAEVADLEAESDRSDPHAVVAEIVARLADTATYSR